MSLLPTNPYGDIISAASLQTGVSAQTLTNLISAESSFNPNAISSAGALGLTQLMPGTAQDLGVTDRTDPSQSIYAGATYLSQLIKRFGSVFLGAAAYNEGAKTLQDQLDTNASIPIGVQNYANKVAGNNGEQTPATPDQLSGQNTSDPLVYNSGVSTADQIKKDTGLDLFAILKSPTNLLAIGLGILLFVFGGLLLVGNSAANVAAKASKIPGVKTALAAAV